MGLLGHERAAVEQIQEGAPLSRLQGDVEQMDALSFTY